MKEEETKARLTVCERQLVAEMERLYPDGADVAELIGRLIRIGVVDGVRCKVLVIRRDVERRVHEGSRKVEAMYEAAERFCCSYEYVRKCMYYYKEINLV